MANSNYIKNSMLDSFFGVGTIYASLHTGDPGTDGSNELVGGSYARQIVTYASASGGQIQNSGVVTFTGLPGATVTHVGFWKNSNFSQGGALTAQRIVVAGDGLFFNAGQIAHTVS